MLENMATDSQSPDLSTCTVLNSSEKLSQLLDEWDKTEAWIKGSEIFVNKLILSDNINEMHRDTECRLVAVIRATLKGDNEEANRHFSEILDNLVKVRHDVVDAIIIDVSDNANKYRESIGAGDLKAHFSGYEEFFGLLRTIHHKITSSRGAKEHRDTTYDKIFHDDLNTLRKLYDQFIASLPAIEQRIQAENSRQNRATLELGTNRKIWIRNAVIGWLIAIIAVIIAVFK